MSAYRPHMAEGASVPHAPHAIMLVQRGHRRFRCTVSDSTLPRVTARKNFPRRYHAVALATLVYLALGIAPRRAAARTDDDFQVWSAMMTTASLRSATPAPALWLDVHGRRSDAGTVHILRPAIGLEVAPFLSFWTGYAWVPTFQDETDSMVNEHRLWNQWILQYQTEFRLALQSRTRIEYRWSEAGADVGLRLRQFARVGWQPAASVPLGAVVWDEVFVGLNRVDWGAPQGFDQNRLFAGPFLQAAPWARLEAGYLYVRIERPDRNLNAHVLAVNLFLSLRMPKK